MKLLLNDTLKGIVLSFLYFEITKANDTSFYNVFIFTTFYIILVNCAILVGIDPNIVTNAFLTKAIFTLVDERIKKESDKDNNSS
uniref:Uncharacterized protein n=1 Tax=viral metagenome TaxID=1070528 RepID=A0A6C0DZA7_9ZZZZ